jgi:serine/threonine-protein kinase HipA
MRQALVFLRAPQPDGAEKYASRYEDVATLVRGIVGEDACREVVRRVVFVICSGNNDAHLKNWSLTYANTINPTLAPLYDQLATVAWDDLDRELALKLAGAREFGRVSAESFKLLATRVGLDVNKTLDDVRTVIASARSTWAAGAKESFPHSHAAALRAHWERVPLLRDVGALDG